MRQAEEGWVNIAFLSMTPVIGTLGAAACAFFFGIFWWEPALFFALFGLVSLSVTAARRHWRKASQMISRAPQGV